MAVPKSKRTTSDVMYFSFAYTVVEKVIKYVLADFGTTRTYRDLHVFTNKAKMTEKVLIQSKGSIPLLFIFHFYLKSY